MQQDKNTYEGTFNNTTSGLFKDNTAGGIGADDSRTLVTNTKDSVPFTVDDSYIWASPKANTSGINTYAVTLSPAITSYADGMKIHVKVKDASTGASTLNANAVGAKKIFTNPTTQAGSGDLVDEQEYIMSYDSALDAAAGGWLIIGSGGGATAAADVTFTPAGGIAATNVQAAIEELDDEKLDSLTSFRTETASHTLDATDLASVNAGDDLKIKMNVAGANTVTIPLNATQAFQLGSKIVVNQIGVGQTSIAATGGVTINSANGWVKIAYQYASVLLTKTATDTWDLEGSLTP